jgi:hypothetical protein
MSSCTGNQIPVVVLEVMDVNEEVPVALEKEGAVVIQIPDVPSESCFTLLPNLRLSLFLLLHKHGSLFQTLYDKPKCATSHAAIETTPSCTLFLKPHLH